MIPLAFTAPLALVGLAALPIVWLILRVTPPRPRRLPFPPLKLILDLQRKDETPARTPWPLLLLRLAIAALAVLAFAGPVWNPNAAQAPGAQTLALIVDDGWPAAPTWARRIAYASAEIEAAGRRGAPVALVAMSEPRDLAAVEPARALERLRALKPKPWAPDRAAALGAIEKFLGADTSARLVWLADGLETGGARAFAEKLASLASTPIDIVSEPSRQRALTDARNETGALSVAVLRAGAAGAATGRVRAFDLKGAPLGEAPFDLASATETRAKIELPVELRNAIAWLDIDGEHSAGAVALIDERQRRRKVGLASGASADVAQPLLAPDYYLTKALGPYADVREARANAPDPVGALIDDGASVLVLSDIAVAPGAMRARLDKYLEDGGVIVRFAGSRLAASGDDLTPATLRRGGRTLGGALSWETPKKLRPFDRESPFFGLKTGDDVSVSRQVLAEPEPGLSERTWAQLADGTPVVTAERRGRGLVVLFHVTADTTWSNLPLSGLFPEMLRRIVALSAEMEQAPAPAEDGPLARQTRPEALAPQRTLDGFGVLGAPPASARPIPAGETARAGADHPPGFYGAGAHALSAVNALAPEERPKPADFSGLAHRAVALEAPQPVDLRPLALGLMLAMFVIDGFAALWYAGGLTWRRANGRRRGAAAVVALAASLALAAPPRAARAQTPPPQPQATQRDISAALATRLAYVVTGDARADEASRLGLQELSRTLAERTSLAPAEPVGVDPARDELVFYPFLYWPIVATRPQPPPLAVQKIAAFMKQGGFVVFDTRDALTARAGGPPSPEAQWLRELLAGVDVPALEPVPRDHVVTKTFYIIDGFVGRTANGQTWIEALPPEPAGESRPARSGDSVSPLIVVSNDLAAAWAADRSGATLYPLTPGGPRQRELALRGGVNLVMYTLTGNYKADQVHVRDLLNRLGH